MNTKFAAIAALSVLAVGPAMASSVTNTPDGGSIVYWGPSSFANQSYGEVFTAPDSELLDFSFIAASDNSYPFVGQVYAWDGVETTGPALYTSGVQTTTGSLTPYTFTTNIAVTTGSSYIAFITNQPGGVGLGGSGYGSIESGSGPAQFLFAEGDPSAAGAWFTYGSNGAFNADFGASAPEPSTWGLMLLGFAVLGGAVRRARSTAASVA